MTTDIIPHSTISTMVEHWEISKLRLKNSIDVIYEIERNLETVFGDHIRFPLDQKPDYEKLIKDLRRTIWYNIIGKTEIKKFLSIKKTNELEKNIENDLLGDITVDNVLNLFRGASANIQNLMDETIVEVFGLLRPHLSGYKRNEAFAGELGNKIILHCVYQQIFSKVNYRVNCHWENDLRAINNAFFLLDGKGYQQSYHGELHDAIEASPDGKGETTYFKFKCYQNGNCHIDFKRMDLVKKINAIASKNELRKAS